MHIEVLILGWLLLLAVVFFIAIGKMKRIKKLMVSLVLVVLALGASFLYVEAHFSAHTVVKCDISAEEILSEMPDIAITEADAAMIEELLAAEEITEAFLLAEETAQGMYDFPVEDAEKLLEKWIPDGFAVEYLSVVSVSTEEKKSLEFSLLREGDQRVYYVFDADRGSLFKGIVVFDKDIIGTERIISYQNSGGEITKWKEKRMWFRWLTAMDRYWE